MLTVFDIRPVDPKVEGSSPFAGKYDRHIETYLQSPGIGVPAKIPLKMSGMTCFVGYSRNQMLQQRFYLNVSKINTLGVSLKANSERCSDEFENGEQLWPENLFMLVLMETASANKRCSLA